MAPMLPRLFACLLLLSGGSSCKEQEKGNNAVVPVPKLENDCYDWWQRHEAVIAAKQKIDPEIVLIGDSITHFWGGEPASPGANARGPKAVFPRGQKAEDPLRTFVSELNVLLAKIAEARHLTFIDLRDKFLEADGTLPSALMSDGVHPTEVGYAIWAEALKKEIK